MPLTGGRRASEKSVLRSAVTDCATCGWAHFCLAPVGPCLLVGSFEGLLHGAGGGVSPPTWLSGESPACWPAVLCWRWMNYASAHMHVNALMQFFMRTDMHERKSPRLGGLQEGREGLVVELAK